MDLTDEMVERFRVPAGVTVHLREWDTKWDVPQGMEELNKDVLKQQAADFLARRVHELAGLQEVLWVDSRYSLLLIFQGADASGKDSTIRHVTSGMNPAGMRVVSFKEPSREELKRNYLWRYVVALPEQGYIGVFNRSYYEEVTVVRVNPQLLTLRAMPQRAPDATFWAERYEDINFLERQFVRNGTVVLKFYLHISKDEQKTHFATPRGPGQTLEVLAKRPRRARKMGRLPARLRAGDHQYQHTRGALVDHACRPQVGDAGARGAGNLDVDAQIGPPLSCPGRRKARGDQVSPQGAEKREVDDGDGHRPTTGLSRSKTSPDEGS